MARCIKCGHTVQEDARFCPECGAEIIENVQTVPTDLTPDEAIKAETAENVDVDTEDTSDKSEGEKQEVHDATADEPQEDAAVSKIKIEDIHEPSEKYVSYKCYEGTSYSGMAIAGFVLSFFVPILGIIFSAVGMGQTKNAAMKGRGLAIAGLTISIVFCCLGCALLLLGGLSMAMVAAF